MKSLCSTEQRHREFVCSDVVG